MPDRCEFCGRPHRPFTMHGKTTWHCGQDKCRVRRHRLRKQEQAMSIGTLSRDARWRSTRIAAGICCGCGQAVERQRQGLSHCRTCADKYAEAARLKREHKPLTVYHRLCKLETCREPFETTSACQRYHTKACQVKANTKPVTVRARVVRAKGRPVDLRSAQIERLIDREYQRIQREGQEERQRWLERYCTQRRGGDPVSAAAPDLSGVFGRE